MKLKNTEKLEKSIVALTFEITADEMEDGKQKAYLKARKNITVPGFRKGKAPRKMIETLYGDGVFFEDAINIAYPDAMEAAVKEAGILPVGPADVSLPEEQPEDGGVAVLAKVPVEPEVTLGEYKGLSAEKETPAVTAEEVDTELTHMAQRMARVETVDREAKNGDTVNLDFEGFVDGAAFEGGKAEGHDLTLGSNTFIPGFEDQLVGVKTGDEKDVAVTFPKEYHAEELAGKEAIFKCRINSVKETILPTMDDEFAKDVSEKAESLADLKKEIEERLLTDKTAEADRAFEDSLMNEVIAGMQADIPEAMFETQVDTIVNDFGYRVQMQGMKLDQYLQMNGMDMPTFRHMFREQAEHQVKMRLALQKIAEVENIEVDDEAIAAEYKKMAEQYGMEVEKVKNVVPADSMTGDIKLNRALEVVKENAKTKKKRAAAKKTEKAEDGEKTEKKTTRKKKTDEE